VNQAVNYEDYSGPWPWENFSPREMACRGTGLLMINTEAMDKLQALRTAIGRPLIVSSAYRSPQHNEAVGGAPRSQHLEAKAFDIRMDNHDPRLFEIAAREAGFTGFGYYPRQGFMHIDIGPSRTWGDPFPRTATEWPVEEEEPNTPAGSTTLQATAVQVASGAGAAATAVGVLDGTAQIIVTVASVLVIFAAIWIMRERIKRLLGGER